MKTLLIKIALWFTPLILLFSTRVDLKTEERFRYFIEAFFKMAPVVFVSNAVAGWHTDNEMFLKGLYVILFINAAIGVWTHLKINTFDIGEFLKSTCITVAVVFAIFISFDIMGESIPDGLLELGFTSSIQIMTLLFPISKIARNSFILSNGQFPPAFLMEKLYNYERDGNIKSFLDLLNKNNENTTNDTI